MPLPQQVVNQLAREPAETPGWSWGILLFAGSVFVFSLAIYGALAFMYSPLINSQISDTQNQIKKLSQLISSSDQAQLIQFYSQASNIKLLLAQHVMLSPLLSWVEAHTQQNIYFTQANLTTGNQFSLSGVAKNESDVNQQVAVFESAPEVLSASLSNVTFSDTSNQWTFDIKLVMGKSIFAPHQQPSS